jgi:uncharacterized protein
VPSEHELLEDLRSEINRLDTTDPGLLETTLLIIPHLLQVLEDYNQFLDPVDQLLCQHGWTGRFQIASFHPKYQFAGTKPETFLSREVSPGSGKRPQFRRT